MGVGGDAVGRGDGGLVLRRRRVRRAAGRRRPAQSARAAAAMCELHYRAVTLACINYVTLDGGVVVVQS